MLQPLLPYTPERDVYRLLGVPASASTDEISAACRRLARTFHPDFNRSARATAEMQVVNTVRQVLTDPDSRAIYDRERRRFHASLAQPSWRLEPIELRPRSRTSSPSLAVYVRAVLIGVRATMAELLPSRCQRCRIVIEGEDRFCAACGTPLLTGG